MSDLGTARLYPQEIFLWTHFCYRLSRPQGHCMAGNIMSMKKLAMTPSGMEPATFRLVAHCLNQKSHWVPHTYIRNRSIIQCFGLHANDADNLDHTSSTCLLWKLDASHGDGYKDKGSGWALPFQNYRRCAGLYSNHHIYICIDFMLTGL